MGFDLWPVSGGPSTNCWTRLSKPIVPSLMGRVRIVGPGSIRKGAPIRLKKRVRCADFVSTRLRVRCSFAGAHRALVEELKDQAYGNLCNFVVVFIG